MTPGLIPGDRTACLRGFPPAGTPHPPGPSLPADWLFVTVWGTCGQALRSRDQPLCCPPGFSFLSSCWAGREHRCPRGRAHTLPLISIRALVCLFNPQPPVPAPSGYTRPQASPLCWVVMSSCPCGSSIWKPRASLVTLSPAALARHPRHVTRELVAHTLPSPPSPMKPRPRR